MQAITKKLHKAGLEKLKPLINQLMAEKVQRSVIIQTAKQYTQSKVREYYRKTKEPKHIDVILNQALKSLAKNHASKAEISFFNLLTENGIEFQFQYLIGHYIVDYLIGDNLVIELDGPQHIKIKDEIRDRYLRKMGYKIIHLPIFIVALSPEVVIEEIKLVCES